MPDAGLQHLPFGVTMGMILSVPMVVAGAWLVHRGLAEPIVPPPPDEAHEPG
ncbi:MAG: prolipoprotein diacylglyceryl transferase, partial [Caulobacteraceae bacterium]